METLRLGSRGPDVELLQTALKRAGYYDRTADGVFCSITESAVTGFQTSQGLVSDGGDVIISVRLKSRENRGIWWFSPIMTPDGVYPATLKNYRIKHHRERFAPRKHEVLTWAKQSRCLI